MFAFPPSQTIADPSSPSRVRCAAPTTRRALDRSGRLCKISPLGKKVGSGKAKPKNKITFYLTYTGILMEGRFHALSLWARLLISDGLSFELFFPPAVSCVND